jgi:uncharacterized protein YraI
MERSFITIRAIPANHRSPFTQYRLLAALLLLVIVTTSACGGLSLGASSKPVQVNITAPALNAELPVGVGTVIRADVSGDSITRVDVQIDGQPYAILTTDDKTKGMPNFPVQVPWTPSAEGVHVLQLIVYGLDSKLLLKSDSVIFKAVNAATAAANATSAPATNAPAAAPATSAPATVAVQPALTATAPVANATPGAQGVQAAQIITVVVTAPPAAMTAAPATVAPTPVIIVITVTATSAGTVPTVIINGPGLTVSGDNINVRSGPGTNYEVIGQLQNGASAAIRGKSADGAWWQIIYPSAPNGSGWVSASVTQANSEASNAPVATAPPAPTRAPTTPTAAAPPTTAERPCDANTPEWKGTDARYPFCVAKVLTWYDNQDGAHRYENGRDVPVSFSWDIWGVDGIWLVFEQDNSGYCGYAKTAVKTINERLPNSGTYAFNVKDFPGGATMRIHLNIKRKDGQVVEYGDKRLCIF